MAKINIPFSDAAILPPEQGMQVNTGALEQRTNQVLSSQNQLLDTAFQQAESARSRAYGAEVQAMEAEQNASLMKLFPAAMKDVGDIVNKSVEKIARLDQAQFDENLQKEMNAYMLDEGFKLQEEYLYYRQQLKESNDADAPKKMSEWMGARMNGVIGKAPSEKAKLAMTEKLMNMKLDALEDGFRIRDMALAEARRKKLQKDMVDALIKNTKEQPENSLQNLQMLTNVGQALVFEGVPKKDITAAMITGQTQIVSATVEGFLNNEQPRSAIKALGDATIKAAVDEKTHTSLLNVAAKAELIKTTTNKKEIVLGVNLSMFQENMLTKGAKGAEEASNVSFNMYRSSQAVPQNDDEVKSAHQQDVKYFSSRNKIMDKETAERLLDEATNISTRDGNPYQAAASALTLNAMLKDNTGRFGDLGTQLMEESNGLYKQKLGAAIAMANKINNGSSVESAAELANKLMQPVSETEQKNREKLFDIHLSAIDKNDKTSKFAKDAYKAIGADKNSFGKLKGSETYLAEFTDATKANYILTGDIEAAKVLTAKELSSKYAMTEINGTPEIMRGAPELYFKNVDKVKAIRDEQVNSYAIALAGSTGQNISYKKETGELVVKDANGKAVNAIKVGIQPIYLKTEQGDDKKSYLLVNQDTGIPLSSATNPMNLQTIEYNYDIKKYNEALEAEKKRRYDALGVDPHASSIDDIMRQIDPELQAGVDVIKLRQLEQELMRVDN